jgi:metal-responsive CopG/Arc/MetJ family transcriptional regulator
VKTAVSIPDRVYQSAEKLAARLGVSRSELYARALAGLVDTHRDELITAQLNEVYGPESEASSLAPDVALLQSRSMRPGKW